MFFLCDIKRPIHPIESKSIQVKRKKNSSFDVGPTSFMARMTA